MGFADHDLPTSAERYSTPASLNSRCAAGAQHAAAGWAWVCAQPLRPVILAGVARGHDRGSDSRIGKHVVSGCWGEFSYKFALWGAALLASSRRPQETYELLATLYQIRSKIVHGGQILQQLQKTWSKIPGLSDPVHFVEACRSVARDILRTYTLRLGNGHNPQAVRERVERNVLEALERGGQ